MALPSPSSILQYVLILVVSYVLFGSAILRSIWPDDDSGTANRQSRRSGRGSGASQGLEGGPVGKLDAIVVQDQGLVCPNHTYKVRIYSREPLVVYLEGFLSGEEMEYIKQISEPLYKPSTIWRANTESLDPTVRHSEKALLPRSRTIQCIEQRALDFQGNPPFTYIERLWSQRYNFSGHYRHHYDWGIASRNFGRVSSFMVYVGAECTGGGTDFPRLDRPVGGLRGGKWCDVVECGRQQGKKQEERSKEETEEEEEEEGVTWKAISGNAVYWVNLREDGTGYEEAWHAGLPVTSGTKIGLNIWSWYQHGYVPDINTNANTHAGGDEK